jgi:hypothetical protein
MIISTTSTGFWYKRTELDKYIFTFALLFLICSAFLSWGWQYSVLFLLIMLACILYKWHVAATPIPVSFTFNEAELIVDIKDQCIATISYADITNIVIDNTTHIFTIYAPVSVRVDDETTQFKSLPMIIDPQEDYTHIINLLQQVFLAQSSEIFAQKPTNSI